MSDSLFITGLKFLSIGGLVLANAFFVAAEFSLVAVRRSRIETLAEGGNRHARTTLEVLNNLDAVISSTQLGITLASLGLGWLGESTLAHMFEPLFQMALTSAMTARLSAHAFAAALSFIIITFLHIVLGELAPKSIALERTERVALVVSAPLQLFYRVFRPFIWLLNACGVIVLKLFGMHGAGGHQSVYTEEEIRQLVSLSHQSGHLNADERELIHNIFHFTSSVVREIMVPRQSIANIEIGATRDQVLKSLEESGYSRLPVYEKRPDNIIGVVHSKDLLPILLTGKVLELASVMRKPVFIPDTAHLSEAMRQMRISKTQLAIVVDEHGSVAGIITLEDLLEEIVGDIQDEHDVEGEEAVFWPQPDGTVLIDGGISIREANRKLDLHLPESDDYTTLAGFLMTEAGKLLDKQDIVIFQGATFVVEEIEGRRISRVRLHQSPTQPENSLAPAGN